MFEFLTEMLTRLADTFLLHPDTSSAVAEIRTILSKETKLVTQNEMDFIK